MHRRHVFVGSHRHKLQNDCYLILSSAPELSTDAPLTSNDTTKSSLLRYICPSPCHLGGISPPAYSFPIPNAAQAAPTGRKTLRKSDDLESCLPAAKSSSQILVSASVPSFSHLLLSKTESAAAASSTVSSAEEIHSTYSTSTRCILERLHLSTICLPIFRILGHLRRRH